MVPGGVGLAVHDGGHTACQLPVLVRKVHGGIAKLVCGILLWIKGVRIIHEKGRDECRHILVKCQREMQEFLESTLILYTRDGYGHNCWFMVFSAKIRIICGFIERKFLTS